MNRLDQSVGDAGKPASFSPEALHTALAQFTGTSLYHQHGINFYLTDGAKYLAEHARCYWLFDAIASYQPQLAGHPDKRLQVLQFWKLTVNADNSAVLTCVADSREQPAVSQKIEFTDFPLPEIQIWVGSTDGHRVAYLPSEH